jgi:hypothetical protein
LIADFDFERVIADRSYDSDEFLDRIAAETSRSGDPTAQEPQRTARYDPHLYKERHLIECFFNKSSITGVSFLDLRNWISACLVSSALLAL